MLPKSLLHVLHRSTYIRSLNGGRGEREREHNNIQPQTAIRVVSAFVVPHQCSVVDHSQMTLSGRETKIE